MSRYLYENFEPSESYRRRLIEFLRHNTNVETGGHRLFGGAYDHLFQIPEELTDFIFALKEHEANNGQMGTFLEIGFASGATNTILNKFFNFDEIVAVDTFSGPTCGNALWANLRFKNLTLICGDSTAERTIERAGSFGPFDLIFIDGNHSYDFVRQDVANYGKLLSKNGVLALHDIAASDWPDIPKFWEEVKAGGEWRVREFIHSDYATHYGIGMMTRP